MKDREKHVLGVIAAAEDIRKDIFPYLSEQTVRDAAALHDCTKELDQDTLCRLYGLEELLKYPPVCHAFTGAEEVKGRGYPEETVNAVRYHTTGRPNMTALEQIVFVADYIEENRPYESCIRRRREYLTGEKTKAALDILTAHILEDTLAHLKEKGKNIHPLTEQTLRFYKKGD